MNGQQIALLAKAMGAAVKGGNLKKGQYYAEKIRNLRLRQGRHGHVVEQQFLKDGGGLGTVQVCLHCGDFTIDGFNPDAQCRWIRAWIKNRIVNPLVSRYAAARWLREQWWAVERQFAKWRAGIKLGIN